MAASEAVAGSGRCGCTEAKRAVRRCSRVCASAAIARRSRNSVRSVALDAAAAAAAEAVAVVDGAGWAWGGAEQAVLPETEAEAERTAVNRADPLASCASNGE